MVAVTGAPLGDLRVLDLSTVVAGPRCATYLADFGAEVIKVERPDGGDSLRNMAWRDPRDGAGLWWKVVNRNKRLIALDLKVEDDREVLKALVADAHVLVENFRPGTLERLGLGPDVLHAISPGLVITRVTGFGQTGPYRDRVGFATVAEAMSGLAAMSGEPDGQPLLPPIALTDEVTGLAAALATMVAVHSGVGQVVDVSLLESMFQLMGPLISLYRLTGELQPRLGAGLPYSVPRGTYRCSDGRWIGASASSDSVANRVTELLGVGDDPRFATFQDRMANREALEALMVEWCAARPSDEVVRLFTDAHAAIGPVMDMADIAADPHYAARDAIVDVGTTPMQGLIAKLSETPGVLRWEGRPLDADGAAIRASGWQRDEPDETPRAGVTPSRFDRRAHGPLHGIRVLDLTRVLSGPHAGRMLCDLGAEVIKVEPPAGDLTRFSNPRVGGLATYFIQQNVGKSNVSLDMSSPAGVELLIDLARHCDVLLENFRPGVMDRMGLGYDILAEANPRLIYASVNGYGSTGPWRHRRAYAPVIGAESGFTKAQGDARARHHGTPTYVNDVHSHADVYTGMELAAGVLAALYQREHTGVGQRIEVSMAQTMLYVNEHTHDHLWDREAPEEWIRSFQPGDYPVLTAANGETVVISGHPAERGTFDLFTAAMGRADLRADPRFASVPLRLEHLEELLDAMREWAAGVPDASRLEDILDANGLAMGVVRSVSDLAASEWAADRGAIVEVTDRSGGVVRIPNSPWVFGAATTGVHGEPKYRGEDNEAVLRDLLGFGPDEIAALRQRGVLSQRMPGTGKVD